MKMIMASVGTHLLRDAILLLTLGRLDRVAIFGPQELHQNVAAEILMKIDGMKVQIPVALSFVHDVIPHQLAKRAALHGRLVDMVGAQSVGVAERRRGEADEFVDYQVGSFGIAQLVGV